MNDDIKVTFNSTEDIKTSLDVGSIQYGQLEIGETITGEAGTEAVVTNSGSPSHAVLNFTIPTGETGPQGPVGPQGPQGIQGEKGSDGKTGSSGVYLGSEEPTDESINVWINPNEDGDNYYTKDEIDLIVGDIETLLGGI